MNSRTLVYNPRDNTETAYTQYSGLCEGDVGVLEPLLERKLFDISGGRPQKVCNAKPAESITCILQNRQRLSSKVCTKTGVVGDRLVYPGSADKLAVAKRR